MRRTKAKRQAAFADQLPDVLQLVTTALRSGYGLTQALDSVAEEAEEPARSEFAHVLVEARLGRDLSEAMRALAQRMESEDLEWVVAAIDINRDTGGNLSEILNTVSATIRERQRMARQVRTLTAEGRLSARILTVLPLADGLLAVAGQPGQLRPADARRRSRRARHRRDPHDRRHDLDPQDRQLARVVTHGQQERNHEPHTSSSAPWRWSARSACSGGAVTARPSAARANLFAGLPQPEAPPSKSASILRRLGQATRRSCPGRSWTDSRSTSFRPGTRTGWTSPESSGSRSPWPACRR